MKHGSVALGGVGLEEVGRAAVRVAVHMRSCKDGLRCVHQRKEREAQ